MQFSLLWSGMNYIAFLSEVLSVESHKGVNSVLKYYMKVWVNIISVEDAV